MVGGLKANSSGELSRTREDVGGPLLLTLLMGNNNNNAQAQAQAQAIPDTFQVKSKSVMIELQSDSRRGTSESMKGDLKHESSVRLPNNQQDEGPLLLTLLLTNQNQNQNTNAQESRPQTQAIPDTLQMKPWSTFAELPVVDGVAKRSLDTTLCEPSNLLAKKLLNSRGMETQSARLTEEQLHSWKRNGFLVIEDALDQHIVHALMADVQQLAEKFVEQRSDECIVHHVTENAAHVRPNGRLLASPTPGEFSFPLPHSLLALRRLIEHDRVLWSYAFAAATHPAYWHGRAPLGPSLSLHDLQHIERADCTLIRLP